MTYTILHDPHRTPFFDVGHFTHALTQIGFSAAGTVEAKVSPRSEIGLANTGPTKKRAVQEERTAHKYSDEPTLGAPL